ncbi:MAG: methylated-DNA--[protein]-cysteine S-methyltransferase [Planctomycetota bacterium]
MSRTISRTEPTASAETKLAGVGRIAIIASAAGLVRVEFLADASPRVPTAGTGAAARMRDRAVRELRSYPHGGKLTCPVVLHGIAPFALRVLNALRRVPRGRTVGYGELAARAGSPKAARAVGNAMARNPIPLWIPCHRVLACNGLGGFAGGLAVKRALLAMEST